MEGTSGRSDFDSASKGECILAKVLPVARVKILDSVNESGVWKNV